MSEPYWFRRRDQWGNFVCCVPGCVETMPDSHELPVCGRCAWMIAGHHRETIVLQHDLEQKRRADARNAAKPAEERWEGWHVVYYVRIGDYIKIGTTKRLRQRLGQLRVSHEDLLAIEEGDHLLEARRHRQFVAERINSRRENFRPSPALLEHIAAIGGYDTLPAWAKRPDTTRIRTGRAQPLDGVE